MGNCITRKSIAAEENHDKSDQQPRQAKKEDKTSAAARSDTFRPSKSTENKKKKTVRFKLDEEEEDHASNDAGLSNGKESSKSGVVRIRLVLTQNELNQILNIGGELKHSSADQLLSMIKSRSTKRVSPENGSIDGDGNGIWIPALESISEDQ